VVIRGALVELWAGPEDGASVYVPPGELPPRLGIHRTQRGELVSIRGRALVLELPHLPVYQRCPHLRPDRVHSSGMPAPLYVYGPVADRWTAGHPDA